jgi:hypothetical protein
LSCTSLFRDSDSIVAVCLANALPLSRERALTAVSNREGFAAPLVGCSGLLDGVPGCTLSP